MTTALLTDHYELTMVQAALHSGIADRPCVFEAFTRRLPPGRRYGVVAGIGRLAEAIADFRFGDAELAHLSTFLDEPTCDWLSRYRFSGSVSAYREGEAYFPNSPVLTVEATFAEGVVLETLVLSILNYDCAVASAAARMRVAAGERTLLEMGGRRTHEQAAVSAARAAYVAGFDVTSNLEAGRRYGIPTSGTAAHAFVLAHDSERAAFDAQVASLGPDTTLLVDTYDTEQGIRAAIDAAGGAGLGAVRIDSGDLAEETRRARRMLDDAGCTSTRIVVSGDLDEFSLAALADAPVDVYGVGTSVVTGSGHPTAGFVYKVVEVEGRPVAKRSASKATVGGRKWATRVAADGGVVHERLSLRGRGRGGGVGGSGRALQVPLADAALSLDEARAHCRTALAELPADALRLDDGEPIATARVVDEEA